MDVAIQILSALLTPLLGIIATCILVCQYFLARQRWRLDLYDKRYPVYNATREFLSYVMQEASVDQPHLFKFVRDCRDKEFLFGKEIQKYLLDLYRKGVDLRSTGNRLEHLPVGEERNQVSQENTKLLKWFGDQIEVASSLFAKYLRIDKK